jgi:hypothetical protein
MSRIRPPFSLKRPSAGGSRYALAARSTALSPAPQPQGGNSEAQEAEPELSPFPWTEGLATLSGHRLASVAGNGPSLHLDEPAMPSNAPRMFSLRLANSPSAHRYPRAEAEPVSSVA